ncbi:MAG: DUF4159 domain-containing protein, partial [Nitratireductor sp.]
RQVMASQAHTIASNIWARLEDGTPLITAKKQQNGWVVLFHVNSDNNWSNLPLSGTFVQMLRRIINLSQSTNTQTQEGENAIRLPALEVLNGQGILQPPNANIKPLVMSAETIPQLSPQNPAGLYGTQDGYVALNVLQKDDTLTPLDKAQFAGANFGAYQNQESIDLKSWLILAALILFLLDCLAVLWFAGAFSKVRNISKVSKPASTTLSCLLAFMCISAIALALSSVTAFAQTQTGQTQQEQSELEEVEIDFSATLQARLAYVKSGISEMDEVSEAGLKGLSIFTASRTALVPGDPIGLDIEVDELSFYPILYWPIHAQSEIPNNKTMARIDSYMKQGGSILFDTRNQISGVFNNQNAPENIKLRLILSSLDIPALEPVQEDHVLTKAFYLLDAFPGRYNGGELWVEKLETFEEASERPARAGDGVSTILITSNDFAGAWAVDATNRPLFPTVPADQTQRTYAYRSGVNILMYMMTGNYKADQVHIPALLERLGQ